MLNFNLDSFNETIKNNHVVIVDFWADWCNPCKALGPIIEKVSKNYPNIVFGKVNVDDNAQLCYEYAITNIPCVLKFVDGKVVDKFVGLYPEDVVERFFAKEA